MSFIEKTFDLKKFTRALRRQPCVVVYNPNPDAKSPEDLNPCLHDTYIHILRHDEIDISNLNFDAFDYGDIDDLETVLRYSPANELFHISDVFKHFEPSASSKRIFI